MSRIGGPGRVAVSVALLLVALSLVAWRQSRAYEALSILDRLQREVGVAAAERTELLRRAQYLESRAHVVRRARERLEMHLPDASEIVYLNATGIEDPSPDRTAFNANMGRTGPAAGPEGAR